VEVTFQAADDLARETLLDLMREFYAEEGLPYDRAVVSAALGPLLAGNRFGRVWSLHHEEAVIGYVVLTFGYSLEFGGPETFVDELYVRPTHRRRGAGRQALEFVASAARELGACALSLEVNRTNAGARALYQRAGFQDLDRCLLTRQLTGGAGSTCPREAGRLP
jgi:ribosomal protein S18 acetylase RimI-like enzyme